MTTTDNLFKEHWSAAVKLRDLEHRQWLSNLPADYQPLLKSSTVRRLELTEQQRRELDAEIIHARIRILDLARQIHEVKFGNVPNWITAELAKLRQQAQGVFAI